MALDGIKEDAILPSLLGRPQVHLPAQGPVPSVHGKVVLITGAGGSIGSELARQVAVSGPKLLLLLDNSEYGLYEVDMAIREEYPKIPVVPLVASVRDHLAIASIFDRYRPHTVFHAAALKHVPLLEVQHNAVEAVRTNVLGTATIAHQCVASDVEVMVLVSTDKAVEPSSIMGRTKRAAELYCNYLSGMVTGTERGTSFIVVRFGNVLGSSGSVIPLFRRQIAQGGPVTVTDEAAVRYFMTISEAVSMLLQASSLQDDVRGGYRVAGTYFLEMGKAVNVMELAKQLIEMVGLRPHVDIPIEIIGMRPGEKLSERLWYPYEQVCSTSYSGLRRLQSNIILDAEFHRRFDNLVFSATGGEYPSVMQELTSLVQV